MLAHQGSQRNSRKRFQLSAIIAVRFRRMRLEHPFAFLWTGWACNQFLKARSFIWALHQWLIVMWMRPSLPQNLPEVLDQEVVNICSYAWFWSILFVCMAIYVSILVCISMVKFFMKDIDQPGQLVLFSRDMFVVCILGCLTGVIQYPGELIMIGTYWYILVHKLSYIVDAGWVILIWTPRHRRFGS